MEDRIESEEDLRVVHDLVQQVQRFVHGHLGVGQFRSWLWRSQIHTRAGLLYHVHLHVGMVTLLILQDYSILKKTSEMMT